MSTINQTCYLEEGSLVQLPEDILMEIQSRLTQRDLFMFRLAVPKYWREIRAEEEAEAREAEEEFNIERSYGSWGHADDVFDDYDYEYGDSDFEAEWPAEDPERYYDPYYDD